MSMLLFKYFYYGKALLELSRVESGVLGNGWMDGVDMGGIVEIFQSKLA